MRHLWAAVCLVGAVNAAAAEPAASWSGGVTGVALLAEGGRATPAAAASFDLIGSRPAGDGAWEIYLEGNTATNRGTVAADYPGTNGDAGTAQLNRSNGTVQISELKYRWEPAPQQTLSAGVIDASLAMDLSATANDENTQFLNAMFVNNPTIAFPDYVPGLAYARGDAALTGFLVLSGSHGLADNPRQSYGELFDLDAPGKGAFVAAGLRAASGIWSGEAGAWSNSGHHTTIDGTRSDWMNYGVYTVVGAGGENAALDLRAGYADPEVNEGERFASLTMRFAAAPFTLGMGYGRIGLAPQARGAGRGDSGVAEIYLRFDTPQVETTLDFQYLDRPNFDSTQRPIRIGGIRLHRGF